MIKKTQEKWKVLVSEYSVPTYIKEELLKPFFTGLNLKGGSVLDAGCGTGYFSKFFSDKKYSVIGIDQNKKPFKHPNFKFHNKDLEKIPLKDNVVDNTLLINVLSCVFSSKKRQKIINEISRVTKDDGEIIVVNCDKDITKETFPNEFVKTDSLNESQVRLYLKKINGTVIKIDDNMLDENEFIKMCSMAGLKKVKKERLYYSKAKRYIYSVYFLKKKKLVNQKSAGKLY
jgi:ubiquinone/menaquinone biosynthesis C-methylase UbiE